jgi:signal transduction histidine kinase
MRSNQPLTAIAANAHASLRWLRSPEPNIGEVQASLEQIVRDSKRASDIIENLRAVFRQDGQEGELREDLPHIVGERVPLQQVLLNLIVNAIEAMSSVTDHARRLSVKTDVHESDCILITVADEGSGIDPQNMKRIFDALFTTKPQGMGLSICQLIVNAHGGRLWAAPGTPHGSTFRVQLPIGQ